MNPFARALAVEHVTHADASAVAGMPEAVLDGADEDEADPEQVLSCTVNVAERDRRIDQVLSERLQLSRGRVQALIEAGRVTADGVVVAAAKHRAKLGALLRCVVPAAVPAQLVPQALPLSVVFEDDDILVIDKPAGIAVHPGAGQPDGTVANAVLYRCPQLSIGGERRPGIVHRLDKDTSGAMVVAKHDAALSTLARAFAERRVDKRYTAFCLGSPADQVEWLTGHRRADGDRRRFTTRVAVNVGRRAHTLASVVQRGGGVSEYDVELLTGRTHQIRAHFADAGHVLLQDALYGGAHVEKRLPPGPVRDAAVGLTRQALHARQLAFEHPRTGERMRFLVPLPDDLAKVALAIRAGP